jgi:[amino group carrier protein]-L-2-aminoadipate 6-kinase
MLNTALSEITHSTLDRTAPLLVVKIGGGAGVDLAACADDLARIALQGDTRLVIVHGVSDTLNHLCESRGVPVRTLASPTGHSSRYTDAETRDLFVEAAEQVNAHWVELLQARGVNAVGLTGDTIPVNGQRKNAIRAVVDGRVRIVRDDYTGTICDVDVERIQQVLDSGGIPVIPPLADSDDGLLNIDGDRAAAAIATALSIPNAEVSLVILSNVRGLYRTWGDDSSLVSQVSREQLLQAESWAEGRMKRKVLGASEALDGGVNRVIIADGRVGNPISSALAGAGTHFEA